MDMSEISREQWEELNEKYEQLKLNEEMYRVAVGMTDHTISVVDIAAHSLSQIYNEGNWTGVSVTMEDVPESVIATGVIHPDDCEGYREFYRKIYSGVPKGEYTMRCQEETRGWVWFTMYYQTVFDEDNNPVRAICFSDDVTVKKRAEALYRKFKEAVVDGAEYVWEVNLTTNKVIEEDKTLRDIFETGGEYESFDHLSEIAVNNVTDPIKKELVRELFSREGLIEAYQRGKREVSLDFPYNFGEGRENSWLHSTAYLLTDDLGNIMAILCSNDISDERHQIEDLENKAENDALTGINNRATFEAAVESILQERTDKIHGFMHMDIDDFKLFNDNYGHAFGDGILQLVAGVLKDTFRAGDCIGRIGGDEFAVFMNSAGSEEVVVERAKILRRNLMDACRKQDLLLTVTLSIGIAMSQGGTDLRTLYLRADEAMYKSKKAGKDCAHVYGK